MTREDIVGYCRAYPAAQLITDGAFDTDAMMFASQNGMAHMRITELAKKG